MDEWINKQMAVYNKETKIYWLNDWMGEWINGWINKRWLNWDMNGCLDGQMDQVSIKSITPGIKHQYACITARGTEMCFSSLQHK